MIIQDFEETNALRPGPANRRGVSNMKIKITADSTCDLSETLLRQWNISLIPMHILMGEESLLDGVTVRPADVFTHVQNGGKMPKSAAPNLVEYTDFFAPFAKDYDAVVHICVGSKFSSCCQNAKLAAQEFGNVSVVDSENICTGQGYLVLRAAKLAADGLPPRNICMRLQALAKKVDLSFVLNQLDYMAKSGRCSGVLAFGANILGKYITEKLADRDDIDTSVVFLSSCQPKPGCLEAVKAGLAQYGKFEQIIETDIGTTIGGYSGPGTIGIVFATK